MERQRADEEVPGPAVRAATDEVPDSTVNERLTASVRSQTRNKKSKGEATSGGRDSQTRFEDPGETTVGGAYSTKSHADNGVPSGKRGQSDSMPLGSASPLFGPQESIAPDVPIKASDSIFDRLEQHPVFPANQRRPLAGPHKGSTPITAPCLTCNKETPCGPSRKNVKCSSCKKQTRVVDTEGLSLEVPHAQDEALVLPRVRANFSPARCQAHSDVIHGYELRQPEQIQRPVPTAVMVAPKPSASQVSAGEHPATKEGGRGFLSRGFAPEVDAFQGQGRGSQVQYDKGKMEKSLEVASGFFIEGEFERQGLRAMLSEQREEIRQLKARNQELE